MLGLSSPTITLRLSVVFGIFLLLLAVFCNYKIVKNSLTSEAAFTLDNRPEQYEEPTKAVEDLPEGSVFVRSSDKEREDSLFVMLVHFFCFLLFWGGLRPFFKTYEGGRFSLLIMQISGYIGLTLLMTLLAAVSF